MAIDIEELEDSTSALSMLLNCEEIIDSADIYCFANWFSGEVIAGPIVKRHWVGMSLLYPYRKMPDPKACFRLLKLGIKVEYNHMHHNPGDTENEFSPAEDHDETNDDTYWLIELTFPRRLLNDIDRAELDNYEDEVELEDVEQAQDTGIDDESAFQADEKGLANEPQPENMENLNAPPR